MVHGTAEAVLLLTTTQTEKRPMRPLFAIDADLAALDELIEERGGEVTDPEAERAWEQWAHELYAERGEKLDRIAEWLAREKMEAAAAREQAELYLKAAKARENRIEDRKRRVLHGMTERGLTRLESATGRVFRVCKNGGKPSMEIDPVDIEAVPQALRETIVQIDREAVRAMLEADNTLPFARLLPVGSHLRIS